MVIQLLLLSTWLINLAYGVTCTDVLEGLKRLVYNQDGHIDYKEEQIGKVPLTSELCRKIFPTDKDFFSITHGGKTQCPYTTQEHVTDKTLYKGSHDVVTSPEVFSKEHCSAYNWQKGSLVADGGAECNDGTNKIFKENSVPLILGFGEPINEQCGYTETPKLVLNPDWKEGDCPEKKYKKEKDKKQTITKCCMSPGKIYHRLWLGPANGSPSWSFCENYRWVLCGAAGYMPNQKGSADGGAIFLVTEPSDILVEVKGTEPIHKVDTGAYLVTVHEVCMLDRVCTNSDELWKMKKGHEFNCKYDKDWKTKEASFKRQKRAESDYSSEIAVQATKMTEFLSTDTGLLLQGVFLALVLMQMVKYCCRSSKAIENEYSELLGDKAENTV